MSETHLSDLPAHVQEQDHPVSAPPARVQQRLSAIPVRHVLPPLQT
ncbi:unnamed protein product [Tenebrio molitor]|nr:unnamed protein product [Tenebrio molitor]